jgi:hypothetical protein
LISVFYRNSDEMQSKSASLLTQLLMNSAETTAQIKDIVLIVFLIFSFAVLLFGTILLLRLYRRGSKFMDRMESLADGFGETFGKVAVARKAMEDAATVLKPVASGLGLLGALQGFGRLLGSGKSGQGESDSE